MSALRDDFAALVAPGDRGELGRAALHIARIAYPSLDVDHWLGELDGLAAGVRPRLAPGASPADTVAGMAAYLFGAGGFRGNQEDYHDPRNSFLNDVLARRTGIPISLAVVLIETGARLGVGLEGVGFPGHFLVRGPGPTGPVLLDPFYGGRLLDEGDLLARYRTVAGPHVSAVPAAALERADTPAILTRMLRNLLRVWVDRGDHERALVTVDLALVLVPDSPEEVRVRGLLYERLGCAGPAVADLRRYLELAPDAADAEAVRERIVRLSRTPTTLH